MIDGNSNLYCEQIWLQIAQIIWNYDLIITDNKVYTFISIQASGMHNEVTSEIITDLILDTFMSTPENSKQ